MPRATIIYSPSSHSRSTFSFYSFFYNIYDTHIIIESNLRLSPNSKNLTTIHYIPFKAADGLYYAFYPSIYFRDLGLLISSGYVGLSFHKSVLFPSIIHTFNQRDNY